MGFENQKFEFFQNSLVEINFFLEFGGLHNKQNRPIWPKYSHIQFIDEEAMRDFFNLIFST